MKEGMTPITPIAICASKKHGQPIGSLKYSNQNKSKQTNKQVIEYYLLAIEVCVSHSLMLIIFH